MFNDENTIVESLYLLIPLALILIGLALKLLFWAISNGQYDDLDTEGHRILFDEDQVSQRSTSKNHTPTDPPSQ